MKCNGFFLLLTVAFFFSCTESINSSSNTRSYEHFVISLEKTACYGRCPVYKITIYGTGRAVYEGKRNVEKVGVYEKQLAKQQVDELFSAYDNASFFDFREEYTAKVTDLPSTLVYFKDNKGYEKKIRDYHGAPEELKELERRVEEIGKSGEGWKKK